MRAPNLKPGDSVLYSGPTDGRYFPAEEPGTIERINGERAWVRYPWGLHYLAVENLRVVERAKGMAA